MPSELEAPVGPPPASWQPDPWGRHQHRWYDGEQWTAHVIDDGAQAHDPPGIAVADPTVPRLPPATPITAAPISQHVATPVLVGPARHAGRSTRRPRVVTRLVKLVVVAGLLAGAVVAVLQFVPLDEGEPTTGSERAAPDATQAGPSSMPTSSAANASAGGPAGPVDLLPASDTVADVVGVVPSPREAELADRMVQSVQQYPDWWTEHVASAGDGPIAYHPNLGLTEAEFEEFMAYAENPTVGVTEQVVISAASNASGMLEIAWTASSGRGSLVIDTQAGALLLPNGESIGAVPWSSTEPDSFLGQARGWEWTWTDPSIVDDVRTGTGFTVTARVGVRDSDGRVYLGVQTGTFAGGTPTARTRIDMLYVRP